MFQAPPLAGGTSRRGGLSGVRVPGGPSLTFDDQPLWSCVHSHPCHAVLASGAGLDLPRGLHGSLPLCAHSDSTLPAPRRPSATRPPPSSASSQRPPGDSSHPWTALGSHPADQGVLSHPAPFFPTELGSVAHPRASMNIVPSVPTGKPAPSSSRYKSNLKSPSLRS